MSADRALAEQAELQHGVVSRGQALSCGLTQSSLGRRIAAGRLVPVHPGVYRSAGAPATWEQALVASCLACGRDTVASHRSAGVLWGLLEATDVVEVTTPRPRCPRPTGT